MDVSTSVLVIVDRGVALMAAYGVDVELVVLSLQLDCEPSRTIDGPVSCVLGFLHRRFNVPEPRSPDFK